MALSLHAHTLQAIPSFQSTLANAKSLIDEVSSWHQGKTYNAIKTFKRADSSGQEWHARVSIHPPSDGSFAEFWNCLGTNHPVHEKEYIPDIHSTVSLGTFGAFEAWSLGYKFTPPVSNRTFTFLIASVLEDAPAKQGYVISLPLDVSSNEDLKSKEPKGIRGRYVSVERIRELDGQIEWRMATMSDAGGLIPQFLTQSQMPSKISEDVPHVLQWIKSNRET